MAHVLGQEVFWRNEACYGKVWGFFKCLAKRLKKAPWLPGSPESLTFSLSKMTNSLLLSLNRLPFPPHPPCWVPLTLWRNKLSGPASIRGFHVLRPFPLTSKYLPSNWSFLFLNQHLSSLSPSLNYNIPLGIQACSSVSYLRTSATTPLLYVLSKFARVAFAPCLASSSALSALRFLSSLYHWDGSCQGHWWPPCCNI